MSFLDTVPAAIEQVDYVGPWERFRMHDPRQCLAALRDACRADTPVTLGAANGPAMPASLWSLDEAAGRLHFNLNGKTRQAAVVAALPQVWAALYLGDVKLQFLLRGLQLGHRDGGLRGLTQSTRSLAADLPTHMYTLPRRQAIRVRHAEQLPPMLHFNHPFAVNHSMALVVQDISTTGCAVRKPAGELALAPGTEIRRVEIELDPQTMVFTDMTVQHVTLITSDPNGSARVGCSWHNMPASGLETLAAWIGRGKRRRELVSISFD
jgi:hypothetical protein